MGSTAMSALRLCPYGHQDGTELGYCAAEVVEMVRRLQAERTDRAGRGDIRGAMYTDKSIGRALRRLTWTEQQEMIGPAE